VHPYSCHDQGVASGWGDDYIAGLECQWIDITDEAIPPSGTSLPLTFEVNPEMFMCEGTPITDAQSNLLFEPTEFTTETGEPIDRPLCTFMPNWDANNKKSSLVTLSQEGSFVTEPCTRSQSGPLRDCGFEQQENALACTPDREVTLHCATGDSQPAQVVRVCETSSMLGTGVACAYQESLANIIVHDEETPVTFTCPAARDALELGGYVSLYVAPVAHEAPVQFVNCTMESMGQLEMQGSRR
jgi:hypothetical protein